MYTLEVLEYINMILITGTPTNEILEIVDYLEKQNYKDVHIINENQQPLKLIIDNIAYSITTETTELLSCDETNYYCYCKQSDRLVATGITLYSTVENLIRYLEQHQYQAAA